MEEGYEGEKDEGGNGELICYTSISLENCQGMVGVDSCNCKWKEELANLPPRKRAVREKMMREEMAC